MQAKSVPKPVGQTTVRAKTKSNPWGTAGEEEEFPTLGGLRVKPQVHSWHVKKPSPKPTISSRAFHVKPAMNSLGDFPSLGMLTLLHYRYWVALDLLC